MTEQDPSRDRQERLAALHQRLDEQVAALREGKDWKAWLDVAARLHGYSFNNVLLIAAARPDATFVGGYKFWGTLGRQVDKGERGIQILAPIRRRVPPPDGDADRESSDDREPSTAPTRAVAGYRVVHVWDVAQTSGQPLPEPPRPQLLRGRAPEGLWDQLAGVVAARGYRLERGDCRDSNGFTDFLTRTVRVREDVDDAQAVKTLAHEVGHLQLHSPQDFGGKLTGWCRGVAEVEAESFAYLVTTSHGMDTGAYTFPYVATWATHARGTRAEDAVRATGARVLAAATTVLAGLDPVRPSDPARGTLSPRSSLAPVRQAPASAAASRRFDGDDPVERFTAPRVSRLPHLRLVAVHTDAVAFFHARLRWSWVPDYLAQRSLRPALQEPWVAGYAPNSWTALTDHLRSRGWDDRVLTAAGLSRTARTGQLIDHFRDRLVLPIRDGAGDVVAFIGRARPGAPDRVPKYLNSPATTIYDKSQTLYGLSESARDLTAGAVPVLVEGPLDVIAVNAATAGTCAAMAPCGTALTREQVAHLARQVDLTSRTVVVATDTDTAGNAAAVRAYELLAPHTTQLLRADLTDSSDPAEHLQRHGPAALRAALTEHTRPLVDDVIDARIGRWRPHLHWVEGRVGAARAVAPVIAALPASQRHQHIEKVATTLGVGADTMRGEVQAALPRRWPGPEPPHPASTSADHAPGRAAGPTSTPPPPPAAVHSRRTR